MVIFISICHIGVIISSLHRRCKVDSEGAGEFSSPPVLPEYHDTVCDGVLCPDWHGALPGCAPWWLLLQLHLPNRYSDHRACMRTMDPFITSFFLTQ